MKRDFRLIKILLQQVEENQAPPELSDYTEEQILYHCELAIEADLLLGTIVRGAQGHAAVARLQRLTMTGHDFLDSARNDHAWKKTMKKLAEFGGSCGLDVFKDLLKEAAKETLSSSG